MAEYENVAKGPLKLKGISDHKIKKKKKKKDKDLSKAYESMMSQVGTSSGSKDNHPILLDKRTKAELAFQKRKEDKMAKQILDKASKSHKERIQEFNQHLDSLTEHFDIPKVSWTK